MRVIFAGTPEFARVALERLLALDKAEDLMNRDILTLDLRNQQRPTLRLAPAALREMRRAMGIVTVENDL